MDGLECSEFLFSDIKSQNQTMRYDSEFFSKEALAVEKNIMQKKHFFLKSNEVVSGPFGSTLTSTSYLTIGDIAFIRIDNIKGGFFIDRENLVYICSTDNMGLSNSQLFTDDLILSKVGNSIGYFARVDDELGTCNISENNIGIKLSTYSDIQKHTMLAYLNSKYGQVLLLRRKSGNAQPKLNVDDVCYIPIPVFSKKLMEKISNLVLTGDELMLSSKEVYQKIKIYLLNKLKLDLSNISTQRTTQKHLSKSLYISGRLDAEYYQPKYDDLFAMLDKLHTKPLGKIVNIMKSIEPGSDYYGDSGIPFIRVSDVNVMGIDSPSVKIPKTTIPSIETLYPKKDTILFSKDGSVGIAYKMEEDIEAVTSGALLHFRVKNTKEVLPDYLTLVLNSESVQLQAERDSSGAIIQHWKPSDIEKVIIPILPINVQQKISENVQESFSLRRQAKKLVQTAVKSVEIAIETDEATALKWIENHICTDFP